MKKVTAARPSRAIAAFSRLTVKPADLSEVTYSRDDLTVMGVPAVCLADDGLVWEFDGNDFTVAEIEEAGSRLVAARSRIPKGPWRHVIACDCEVCRLGTA